MPAHNPIDSEDVGGHVWLVSTRAAQSTVRRTDMQARGLSYAFTRIMLFSFFVSRFYVGRKV